MADDNLELDLDQLDSDIQNQGRISERMRKLAAERGEAERKATEAADKATTEATARLEAETERDFFKGFSAQTAKYPAAAEYQDQILEKVKANYSVEDATVSVLNAEGKLTQPAAPVPEPETAAGGSAVANLPPGGGQRTVTEMTQDERRAELLKAEQRGDISVS